MKLKQIYSKQILKLHLLKHKIHENGFSSDNSEFITNNTLNQTLINFKKILQIIFRYHIKNRRILFVGLPKKLELRIIKSTQHVAISDHFDLTNIFSVSSKIERSTDRKMQLSLVSFLLPKLSRKPDLIVLVSHKKTENFLKDCSTLKIPIINLDSDTDKSFVLNPTYSYKLGLRDRKITMINSNNIFFIGLNFLFKGNRQK